MICASNTTSAFDSTEHHICNKAAQILINMLVCVQMTFSNSSTVCMFYLFIPVSVMKTFFLSAVLSRVANTTFYTCAYVWNHGNETIREWCQKCHYRFPCVLLWDSASRSLLHLRHSLCRPQPAVIVYPRRGLLASGGQILPLYVCMCICPYAPALSCLFSSHFCCCFCYSLSYLSAWITNVITYSDRIECMRCVNGASVNLSPRPRMIMCTRVRNCSTTSEPIKALK